MQGKAGQRGGHSAPAASSGRAAISGPQKSEPPDGVPSLDSEVHPDALGPLGGRFTDGTQWATSMICEQILSDV